MQKKRKKNGSPHACYSSQHAHWAIEQMGRGPTVRMLPGIILYFFANSKSYFYNFWACFRIFNWEKNWDSMLFFFHSSFYIYFGVKLEPRGRAQRRRKTQRKWRIFGEIKIDPYHCFKNLTKKGFIFHVYLLFIYLAKKCLCWVIYAMVKRLLCILIQIVIILGSCRR